MGERGSELSGHLTTRAVIDPVEIPLGIQWLNGRFPLACNEIIAHGGERSVQ